MAESRTMEHEPLPVATTPAAAAAPPAEPAPAYRRYHIATAPTPDLASLPDRFLVKVNRFGLARHMLAELRRHWGQWEVVTHRPCVYGVFSGPVGGFAPRPWHCVGCLRCTISHPEFVRVLPNPAWRQWGDGYFTPQLAETVLNEAATGALPVKGQGYRGRFGGPGWDAMWTDMSEIVRPTRDGIHGREFISTVVDIGPAPMHLEFGAGGELLNPPTRDLSLPLPLLFDIPPARAMTQRLLRIVVAAAREVESLALVPLAAVLHYGLRGPAVAPVVRPDQAATLTELGWEPRLVELTVPEPELLAAVRAACPGAVACLRLPLGPEAAGRILAARETGVGVFHLVADYHGRGSDGRFARELLREVHGELVAEGVRDTVTLLGSGGIVAAEHVPKALICGLDAVALDTAVLLALQAQPLGECVNPEQSCWQLPPLREAWGVQRLKNLFAAWRDQLLEILGAMGLREVRRLRGEHGRAMFQAELEREAFGGIDGYE